VKLRKRNVLLLLVASTIFGLASVTPASSQTSASTSTLKDGVLRLHLGAGPDDRFIWQSPPGSTAGQITQGIAPSGLCGLQLQAPDPAGADLVSLSPSPNNASVGFVSDGIGVRTSGEGTGPCGRIDGNQKLTLQLSSRIAPTTGVTKAAADFAELDMEGKFNAIFTIKGSLNGGTSLTQTYNTMGGDSGPDSGDGDNYRVRFPKTGRFLFNSLEISVSSGAVSLEGGADGTQPCDSTLANECLADGSLGETLDETTDSLIHVVQYDTLLNCNDPAFVQGGGTIPENSLLRVNNESGTCTAVPIDLDASISGSEQLVSLRKDLMGQQAQFFWTVTWTPEDKTLPVKVTQFDFGDGTGYRNIQWCLADDGDDDSFPELPFTASTSDPANAKDPWCLTSQHSDLGHGSGKLTVKETYFGLGDPGAKR
jgi:hypothetical protein